MPGKQQNKIQEMFQNDIFTWIWIVFIGLIIYFTYFGREFVREMIITSIMFLAFFLLEPLVKMAHGSKVTEFLARGKNIPPWKRFPIFFIAILIVFAIKHFLEENLNEATFPEQSVTIVLVVFWLIALFAIYYLIFQQHSDDFHKHGPKSKRVRKT